MTQAVKGHIALSFLRGKDRMENQWVNRIILACALLMFLFCEGIVTAASLGWPNARAMLGARRVEQLLVNVFLVSIPFVVGVWGCARVKRLESETGMENGRRAFTWLWRQYLAGTVVAYVAILSTVMSVADAFRPK